MWTSSRAFWPKITFNIPIPDGRKRNKPSLPTFARAIRYPSIVSTGRTTRIFGDTAVVHGSESDEVEADGKRLRVDYMYLDVLLKRDGEWKFVASQLARPMEK